MKGELRGKSALELQQVADDFSKLPIQFLNFHGGSDLDDVIEAMDFAVRLSWLFFKP